LRVRLSSNETSSNLESKIARNGKDYRRARELGFGVDDRRADTLVIYGVRREAALRRLAGEFPCLRWYKL
jgi:hypothetical protein